MVSTFLNRLSWLYAMIQNLWGYHGNNNAYYSRIFYRSSFLQVSPLSSLPLQTVTFQLSLFLFPLSPSLHFSVPIFLGRWPETLTSADDLMQPLRSKFNRIKAEVLMPNVFSPYSFQDRQPAWPLKPHFSHFSLLSKYCWWCELDVGSRDVFSTESRDLAKQTFMCGTLPPMQYYPAQMKHLSLDVHISTVLKRKLDALLNGVCIPGRLVLAHLPQQRTALCIL